VGADSVVAYGRDVTFYVTGPLAPGATARVHYSVGIVSAGSDVIQNTAVATVGGGTAANSAGPAAGGTTPAGATGESESATALVRVQRAWPLETRAVIGKIFVDANRNGRQDGNEQGLSGVAVWTEDGEIATSDSEGRFSFQNLRPGRHGYHIDPATVPTGLRVPEPLVARDGSGWPTQRVSFAVVASATLRLVVPDVGGSSVAARDEKASVPALRNAAERAAEQRREITAGPGVSVFTPVDGAVLPSDRVFVGVRGEPGTTVALFDGAARLADGQVRRDGIHDFIAVPLARGPHRLGVAMTTSWGQERWDSLTVHVAGLPARFHVARSNIELRTGGVDTLSVQVLDQWSVPVTTGALVTLAADGAELLNADDDRSSAGVQVRADSPGWVSVQLQGGPDVGVGTLALHSGDATDSLPLEILPAAQPFMMTAVGQVGVGAAPDAFGAVTARGSLDARTAFLLSVDSRQLDAGLAAFGRTVDPLGEAQYPMLGDASSTRTQSASRYAVSARVERGLDWLAAGDLTTGAFASGLVLSGYDRALSGVAARLTTGAVVWQGFGSASSERLAQLQLRGAGSSGPYDVGVLIRAGTERVVLETRAFDAAQQILARQELVRFIDSQIDYAQGLPPFQHP